MSYRIAMISHYLPSRSKIGAGYQAHYLANALCRRGFDVTMFSPSERPVDAVYDLVQIPVGQRLRTFRFAWELRRYDFSPFDVIHAHGDDYWLWGGVSKPAHVRTMHGSCWAEARHVPRMVEKLRMALLGFSEAAATFVADQTVCVSENTRKYYPWTKKVIVNGVDMSLFRPGGQKEVDPTILFVGTYSNRKRGNLLMSVFAEKVRPIVPNARLWMVCGDAPQADGVTVFGRVSSDTLADLYRRAWVFCLPSSYEGFGVPYIEGMASGLPVVATPNVGAVEVLGNGKYGALTEPEGLGAALCNLLSSPDERDRLSKLGFQRAATYDWNRIVDQYELVYAEVIGKRASTSIGVAGTP